MTSTNVAIRGQEYPVSIAPMMDRTDRHFRAYLRLFTKHALLYTEMITTGAILHGNREDLLGFSPEETPLALQLGGDDPRELETCVAIGADAGYTEINLNVGCPSARVQHRNFGACLMADPPRVADCVSAMRETVDLPVTVKHRIGIDDRDHYEDLLDFVSTVAQAGCDRFIVHARKAILGGLSPKQNRSVPPLRYGLVDRLKQDLPSLRIEINGGITQVSQIKEHLQRFDGVMIGRAAVDDTYVLAEVDGEFFGARVEPPTRREIVERLIPYATAWVDRGTPLSRITKSLIGLVAHQPGARKWRQFVNARLLNANAKIDDLRDSLALL